jgi:ElaB/YqjD/DUF883 family membrane-anchored ribosome-binding protein
MSKKNVTIEEVKEKVAAELEKSRKIAEKELAKVKKHLDGTLKTVDTYVKKNPEKAAAVAAGIGAALGAAISLLVSSNKKK